MNIIQRLIPATITKTRPGTKMVPKFITLHETDNDNKGANAEAHANLQARGNDRTASWHLTVDDKTCYQSLPFNEVGFHAGDGHGQGNYASIGLEMCVNADGDYLKTVKNTAEIVRQLMKQFNIPIDRVVQHNNWSGKNCPSVMRSGKKLRWDQFKVMLKDTKDDWVKENSVWYYFEDGEKRIGWLFDDNKWYYLNEKTGAMITGWYQVAGTWYYFNNSGVMQTGWMRSSGKWYYLDHNGKMAAACEREVDGDKYTFDKSGAWIQ